jgi:hypothetical protein
MNGTSQEVPIAPPPASPKAAREYRLLMVLWMLLGAATGIKFVLVIGRLLNSTVWQLAIAVPLGGLVGARIGVRIGAVASPRWLVLLMVVLAGAAVGAVAATLSWTEVGEISDYVIGGAVGAILWIGWITWLFIARRET